MYIKDDAFRGYDRGMIPASLAVKEDALGCLRDQAETFRARIASVRPFLGSG